MAELAAEAVGAAEELAVDEDAAADADLAEDADEVLDVARDALPVLGERGEVGLVLGAHGKAGQPRASSSATGISDQPRFGARSSVPVCASTRPGSATATPAGDEILRSRPRRAPPRHPASRFSTGPGDERRLSRVHTPLVADVAGQILDADGEVVDVDLEPDRDDAVAELERLGRPADPPERSSSPVSRSRSSSISSPTRLETVPRVSPVSAATRARERGSPPAICCSTTPRFARRTVVWSAREVALGRARSSCASTLGTGDVGVDSVKPRRRVLYGHRTN